MDQSSEQELVSSRIGKKVCVRSCHWAVNRLDYERRRGITTVDHSDIRGLVTAGQVSVGGCLCLQAGVQFNEELCHKGVSRVPRTAFGVSLVIGTVRSFRKAWACVVSMTFHPTLVAAVVLPRYGRVSGRSRVRLCGDATVERALSNTTGPGLRCANGASGLWQCLLPEVVFILLLDIGAMP